MAALAGHVPKVDDCGQFLAPHFARNGVNDRARRFMQKFVCDIRQVNGVGVRKRSTRAVLERSDIGNAMEKAPSAPPL